MIQELQTERLDINNKYDIDFSCKQLDDIILKIIVYDKSIPANLGNYTCRLKAFKRDQVPLIQNTNITIKDNVVTIKADKQLTTTNGIVKAELQFINKTTLEKKSTFYINIEVVASVLDVDGIVSTPTCTILEEIDHKLDEIENIGQVLDEAKDVRDTLTNKTIPAATNINSKLESNINSVNTKITEVENIISSATSKIEEVETSINNADSSKKELDLSKTNADISKENLDTANTLAEKNIEELNSLGNVTDLAKNVQTNTTDIGTLKENVQTNTSQLKDCAKNIENVQDLSMNYKTNKNYEGYDNTKIYTWTKTGVYMTEKEGVIDLPNGWNQGRYNVVTFNNTNNDYTPQLIFGDPYDKKMAFRYGLNENSKWKQLAIVDDTGWLDLPLTSGITADGNLIPKCRKVNNQVFICGSILGIDSTNKVVATLPVGFRPQNNHYYASFKNGFATNAINIYPDGGILVQGNSSNVYNPSHYLVLGTNFII